MRVHILSEIMEVTKVYLVYVDSNMRTHITSDGK